MIQLPLNTFFPNGKFPYHINVLFGVVHGFQDFFKGIMLGFAGVRDLFKIYYILGQSESIGKYGILRNLAL